MYEKREQRVVVKLSESEKRMATDIAERLGVTLSCLLRYRLRSFIGMPAPEFPDLSSLPASAAPEGK